MKISQTRRRGLLAGSATLALAAAAAAVPANAVVPNETTTSEEIVDNNDEYRGVGMFYRADGFVCTGTLINPRTVLFAAHCVNDRPETDYNADNVPAAFSFNVNALPGFQNWFANNFASNPELAVFNINRIFYDQRSLQNPAAFGFIEADIALASLDTPAAGIPTWALLFSTLPTPDAIDPVNGTGYHVNIVGYGATGNAAQGPIEGIDFRRRAAENLLGVFASLDDTDAVLFGPAPPSVPQNLYQLDFDSQARDFFQDINIFRDDALPNEGVTAGGDSGGPLILDAANNSLSDENLVIGTLSGGSRIFNVPFSSIGTTSFYQPLSLYWQYIAATNPYRYVGAVAGNGAWEDENHWVSLLDPAYRVIDANGAVVNGIPTTPELGLNGTEGDFGAVCVEFEAPGDGCVDLATGEEISTFVAPASTVPATGAEGAVANGRAQVSLDAITGAESTALPAEVASLDGTPSAVGRLPGGSRSEVQSQVSTATLPAPTLANGLPGATGFVPDNIDAVTTDTVRIDPRYFDVTLSQTGTTTLSSDVTIDRLTVSGNAGLTIGAAGNLTSLIDINQFGGRVNVNGGLTSIGDYTLFGGMLEGTGTVTAPFLTSVTGVFSPGTMGTIGTLTIDGNLVMASGSTFLVDVAADGTSDQIAVTGIANVGGVVGLGAGVTQQVNGNGRQYTILTADGGVTGAFTETTISAILSQTFTYQENAVLMEIEAASYTTAIDTGNPVQSAYANLFDQNRANAALAGIYGLDFADAPTIRTTFEGLAPVNEQAVRSMAGQTINVLQNFYDGRLREADRAEAGGKIAVKGAPLNVAQAALSPVGQPIGVNAMALQSGSEETEMVDANLPEDVAMFVAAGAITGDSDSLPGYTAGSNAAGQFVSRNTEISGFYLAGGLEFFPGENTMIGISGYYSSLDADVPLGQQVESDTYAAAVYLRHKFAGGAVLDGQLAMGSMGFDTTRTVPFLGANQTLTSSTDDLLVSGALGVSYDLELGGATISPGVEARYARVDLGSVRENGGNLALSVQRESFESKQARAGFDFETQAKVVQINATAQYVHEFEDGPQLLAANFAQGTGPGANFLLDRADQDWLELGISAQIGRGPMQFGIGFDSTFGRSSADARAFRASATYRF
jgi:uncharacterized protein with beta-barrel porin domain